MRGNFRGALSRTRTIKEADMIKKGLVCMLAASFLCAAACTHKVQVEPIHITVDVNIKVDKALDDFFGDLDNSGPAAETSPKTR